MTAAAIASPALARVSCPLCAFVGYIYTVPRGESIESALRRRLRQHLYVSHAALSVRGQSDLLDMEEVYYVST